VSLSLSSGVGPAIRDDVWIGNLVSLTRVPRILTRTYVYVNAPDSVPKARYVVRSTLQAWEYEDDVIEPSLLIISELATNAVVHATDSPIFKVICELRESILTVGVIDFDERLPVKYEATEDDEGGRGLLLIESLADDWGTTVHGHGKLVFGRLHVIAPPLYVFWREQVRADESALFS
jgi:anti-sigma regulatory factor (Ser/Thr protein kinase)